MKYLVTGGAGFIGSHLTDCLAVGGNSVVVLDDLSTGRRENLSQSLNSGSVELVVGSILDAALVEECVAATDVCFHLAAAVGVELILDEPLDSLIRNVRGTDVVLGAVAARRGKVIVVSSSEVYGKNSVGPLVETADRVLGPPSTARWAYATAKSFSEVLANAYSYETDTETINVRLFNTVGPRQTGAYGMVLPRLVGQAITGEPLTVHGDGSQTRCFTHVADVVEAMLLLCDRPESAGRTFNIGSPHEISILDLARRVIERTGSESQIRFIPYEEAYGPGFEEIGRRRPDLTQITSVTGWAPTHTIDDMIDDASADQRGGVELKEVA